MKKLPVVLISVFVMSFLLLNFSAYAASAPDITLGANSFKCSNCPCLGEGAPTYDSGKGTCTTGGRWFWGYKSGTVSANYNFPARNYKVIIHQWAANDWGHTMFIKVAGSTYSTTKMGGGTDNCQDQVLSYSQYLSGSANVDVSVSDASCGRACCWTMFDYVKFICLQGDGRCGYDNNCVGSVSGQNNLCSCASNSECSSGSCVNGVCGTGTTTTSSTSTTTTTTSSTSTTTTTQTTSITTSTTTTITSTTTTTQGTCTSDSACPEKTKCSRICPACPVGAVCAPCQLGYCIDVGCVAEGSNLPGAVSPDSLKHMATTCCAGLSAITNANYFDANCNKVPLAGAGNTCANCGNGICGPGETKCNCPQDCGTTTSSCTNWGIQVSGFSTPGRINAGDKIQVVYKPPTTEYYRAGERVSAPNDYFKLNYDGWNTDNFATITVKPINGVTAYDEFNNALAYGNLNGLEIKSDTASTIVGRDNEYVLFGRMTGGNYQIYDGYYDSAKGKILVVDHTGYGLNWAGSWSLMLNEKSYTLRVEVTEKGVEVNSYPNLINNVIRKNVIANYQYKTPWTTSSGPELRLGAVAATAERYELNASSGGYMASGNIVGVGLSNTEVVTDDGYLISSPSVNGGSDQVVFKIAGVELKNKVSFSYLLNGLITDIRLARTFAEDFPNGGVRNIGSGSFAWKSNSYNYHEQADVSGINMDHSFFTSNINGTEKMIVENNDIKYEYVFDSDVNFGGTISNPDYTNPIKIKLMGKDFTIVGIGTTSIKVLQGSMGVADSSTPVKYDCYSVYAIQGANNDWVKVQIKDNNGNIVATDTVSITGGAKSFSSISLDVRATRVQALQDGTVIGADLVVGPTGTTEKEYDTSADTTSTGTASDRFPCDSTTTTTCTVTTTCESECKNQGYIFGRCSPDGCQAGQFDIGTNICPAIQVPCALCIAGQPCPSCNPIPQNCCCSNKATCPLDCCQNDPNYLDKNCLTNIASCICPACPVGVTPCPPCTCPPPVNYVCSNHKCVQGSQYILNFQPGWNMFSWPVKGTGAGGGSSETQTLTETMKMGSAPSATTTTQTVLPTTTIPPSTYCNPTSKIYHYANGGYEEATYPTSGYGYWVKMQNSCSITLSGEPVTVADFAGLGAGWNQIGSPSQAINFFSVIGSCNLLSGPWKFNSYTQAYEKSQMLLPGEGYFVRMGSSCTLGTDIPSMPPEVPTGGMVLTGRAVQIIE